MRPCSRSRPRTRYGTCHSTAFIRTATASLGAGLTMVHLMLSTLICAGFANIRTDRANRLGHVTVSRHVACCKSAHLRAIHVECNASGHHLDVVFLQARSRTIVTSCCTLIACVNTCLKLLLRHRSLLISKIAVIDVSRMQMSSLEPSGWALAGSRILRTACKACPAYH
jgi:hypothetical protein